jgi:hypothetical protein
MKKITLLLLAIIVLSCSSDDDTPKDQGYMKVLSLGSGVAPGQPIIYTINYGTKENEDEVFTVVPQDVYEYYEAKWMALGGAGKPRWRGMITQDPD